MGAWTEQAAAGVKPRWIRGRRKWGSSSGGRRRDGARGRQRAVPKGCRYVCPRLPAVAVAMRARMWSICGWGAGCGLLTTSSCTPHPRTVTRLAGVISEAQTEKNCYRGCDANTDPCCIGMHRGSGDTTTLPLSSRNNVAGCCKLQKSSCMVVLAGQLSYLILYFKILFVNSVIYLKNLIFYLICQETKTGRGRRRQRCMCGA